MNTQTERSPSQVEVPDWVPLFVSRWCKGKVRKRTQFHYTMWEAVQIRGRGESPTILNIFVHGQSSRWLKAGVLRKRGDEWTYHPSMTSYAPQILESLIVKYLI